jgi:hypothetical protein
MPAKPTNTRMDRLALTFEKAMTPIFAFALLNAAMCWIAAWVFRDTYEFSATLVGLGCFPIVVAACAYLMVLVNAMKREG